jgi:hypothetical protein
VVTGGDIKNPSQQTGMGLVILNKEEFSLEADADTN